MAELTTNKLWIPKVHPLPALEADHQHFGRHRVGEGSFYLAAVHGELLASSCAKSSSAWLVGSVGWIGWMGWLVG